MEAPWPLELAQKDTQRDIKLHKTPRDGAEHGEGEEDTQGTGDRRARRKLFGTSRGLGRRSRPTGGGADVQAAEAGRGRKETSDGIIPGADRDLGASQGWQRGGKHMREIRHSLAEITPCGRPTREGSIDERWRPAGGGAFQVDGRSTPGQVGGDKRVKLESKAALTGEIRGRDRTQVQGGKTRDPETVETGGLGDV